MPHNEIPLTEKGRAQAIAVSALLPVPARVLVSGLQRTSETAQPYLARHGVAAERHLLLNEFNMLSYELICDMDGAARRVLSDAYWADPLPARRCGETADSFSEFAARVDGFIEEMSGLPDDTVIFGHGTWMALLCWRINGGMTGSAQDMAQFRAFSRRQPVENTEIIKLVCNGNGGWNVCRAEVSAL